MDREYSFKGTVELRGVEFIVTAKDENEAKLKALKGEWDHYETDLAECFNSEVEPTTCKLNE